MILNIVVYIFYALGILLALAIIAAVLFLIINGPKDFNKDNK